jgi:hypothetical protein
VEATASDWTLGGFVRTGNFIPQVWRVRAVEQAFDDSITVHDLNIADGSGTLDVNFDGLKRMVVFVIGQTRFTSLPASFRVEVK